MKNHVWRPLYIVLAVVVLILSAQYVIVPKDFDEKRAKADSGVNKKVYVGQLEREHAEKHDLPKMQGHKLAKIPTSGGSLTALPIIETLEGEVSAYIPTNVISITDGQIYLETDLFNSGIRPAVNVGLSVSRVGFSAAIKAMKQVGASLKLELAQYRELAAFAMFASDLDKASQNQLNRGQRLTEILKQGQYQPLPFSKQITIIFAGTNGFLDDLPVNQCRDFEQGLYKYIETNAPGIFETIETKKALDEQLKNEMKKAIQDFKDTFVAERKEQQAVAAK